MAKQIPIPSVKLNSGYLFPALGIGSWFGRPPNVEQARNALDEAIKVGVRHFDTAFAYQTEVFLGEAIKNSGIPREEFFITTKLPNAAHAPWEVPISFEQSLKNLGVDYIDLYLMHWPQGLKPNNKDERGVTITDGVDYIDTWLAMEELVKDGKGRVRSLGVSNFHINTMERLLTKATIVPAVNQVEMHPYLVDAKLKAYHDEKGIVTTAYSPLGANANGLKEDPVVTAIASAHGILPSQVLVSWAIQRGTTTCPRSGNRSRIRDNFKIFELTTDDMKKLDALDTNKHYAVPVEGPNEEYVLGWTKKQLGWEL